MTTVSCAPTAIDLIGKDTLYGYAAHDRQQFLDAPPRRRFPIPLAGSTSRANRAAHRRAAGGRLAGGADPPRPPTGGASPGGRRRDRPPRPNGRPGPLLPEQPDRGDRDRKSTRLNSSHG